MAHLDETIRRERRLSGPDTDHGGFKHGPRSVIIVRMNFLDVPAGTFDVYSVLVCSELHKFYIFKIVNELDLDLLLTLPDFC